MDEEQNGQQPLPAEDSIARVMAGWQANRPDLDVEAIAITARLARLRQALGTGLERVFTAYGLTGADFAVLATIVRLGGRPLSQKRLMTELNLTAGTISVRIDRLVADDLVRREPKPSNGRGSQVVLTVAGRAAFEACAPEHLRNAAQLIGGLDDDERHQLGQLLAKLLRSLE